MLAAAGTKWNFLKFKPGLVGGHCIGVDPYYLTQKAEQLGYHPEVILAGRRINDGMGQYVAQKTGQGMLSAGQTGSGARVGDPGSDVQGELPGHPQHARDRYSERAFELRAQSSGLRPDGAPQRSEARVRL